MSLAQNSSRRGEYAKGALNMAAQYTDWLTAAMSVPWPRSSDSGPSPPWADEGGGYRDDQGNLHDALAVCTISAAS